jgi:SAM-dependent methyltransferase
MLIEEYDAGAAFYDAVPSTAARQDVAFYVKQAGRAEGPVLELGCGTGRVLIPTARAGATITGLDKSEAMLALCHSKLAAEPAEVQGRATLVTADMRDFSLGGAFSLITTPFRSFQRLLTVADQLACLHAVRRHLSPRGRFILDLFNPSLEVLATQVYPREAPPEPEFEMSNGRRVVRRDRTLAHDRANQVFDVEILYEAREARGMPSTAVQRFQQRYLFRYEAEHLLARAGFKVEALYSDYDESPIGSGQGSELIFVASS